MQHWCAVRHRLGGREAETLTKARNAESDSISEQGVKIGPLHLPQKADLLPSTGPQSLWLPIPPVRSDNDQLEVGVQLGHRIDQNRDVLAWYERPHEEQVAALELVPPAHVFNSDVINGKGVDPPVRHSQSVGTNAQFRNLSCDGVGRANHQISAFH